MRGWQTDPSQGYTLTLTSTVATGTHMGEPSINTRSDTPNTRSPRDTEHDPAEESITWSARIRSGRMTAEEWAKFDSWSGQSPAHERAFQEINALWNDPDLIEAAAEVDRAVPRSAPSRRSPRPWPRMLAAAATVFLVMTAVVQQFDLPLRLQADYMTAVGERHTITLADQSTVVLNTRSAVASDYRTDGRHVRLLKGEALFRVQPDKTRPFLVEHRGVVARAIGTAFIVRERREGLQISVIEGVVAVQSGNLAASLVSLTAGQQALLTPNGATSVQPFNPDVAVAWVQGRLVFDTMPFAEVLEEIARYHAGYIGLWNPALVKLRVSGTYNLSNTSSILTTLQQTLPVHMTRLTDRFVVFR